MTGTTSFNEFQREINPVKAWQGDLDLYFHWKINKDNKIYVNVIPSLITSESSRDYTVGSTNITSGTDNRSLAAIFRVYMGKEIFWRITVLWNKKRCRLV